MSGKIANELKADLYSLGWQCHERELDDGYLVIAEKENRRFAAAGADRELVWNEVYQDVITYSAKDGTRKSRPIA